MDIVLRITRVQPKRLSKTERFLWEEENALFSPSRTITQSAEQFAAREKLPVFVFPDRIFGPSSGGSRGRGRAIEGGW